MATLRVCHVTQGETVTYRFKSLLKVWIPGRSTSVTQADHTKTNKASLIACMHGFLDWKGFSQKDNQKMCNCACTAFTDETPLCMTRMVGNHRRLEMLG
jgi:hypothetical protein